MPADLGFVLLAARKEELRVFALRRQGVTVAAAQIGTGAPYDADSYPPDAKPPKLRMVAARPLGKQYGPELVKRILAEVEPGLVHDGHLSQKGLRLVEKTGLPSESGEAATVTMSDADADLLANDLLHFAADNPEHAR